MLSPAALQRVLEASPFPVITMSPDGDVLLWNQAATQFFGWSSEEARQSKLHLLIIPERFRERHLQSVNRYIQTGSKVFLGSAVRVPALRKDGSEVMVEIHVEETTPVVEQEGAKPPLRTITAYVKDLSSQLDLERRADERHAETLQSLLEILKHSKFAVFTKDVEGKYTFANDNVLKFVSSLGNNMGSAPDVVGKTDYEIFSPEVAEDLRQKDLEVMNKANAAVSTVEETLFTPPSTSASPSSPSGPAATFVTTRSRLCNANGSVIGIFGFAYDITEYKNALLEMTKIENEKLLWREQNAIARSRQKSAFLANMSHEIRTPINAIISLTSLLLDTQLSSEQKDYLIGLKQSSSCLMSLVNDILDISKIESGRIQLEELDTEVSELISELCTVFRHPAKSKKLHLHLHDRIPEDKKTIKVDSGRLRQVLNNILSNALKFTFTGRIDLYADFIEAEPEPQISERGRNNEVSGPDKAAAAGLLENNNSSGFLKFTVVDTGLGIPADKQSLLFEPFSQAEASTTRRFGGTGLGLSISKNLVNLMRGDIGFSSQENEGSTFWFTIPYIKGEAKPTGNHHKAVSPPPKRKTSTRFILVVDDNSMNLKVAMKLLERGGYKSIGCENGAEALQSLQTDPHLFGLVLMDCSMPVLDGYETTRRIRQLPPPLGNIPVVAMTANAMEGEREHCLQVGMDDYLSKPIHRATLLEKAAFWISKYEEEDAA